MGELGAQGSSRRVALTGVFVLLAAVLMLFAAFISAFLVRAASDTRGTLRLPATLWWNTVALLASSLTIELARQALRSGMRIAFNRLWTAGTLLGVGFLAGQFAVWRELRATGVYVAANPISSFFYVLTAAHAAHLLGGLVALAYVDFQALRLRLGPGKRTAADASAIYWHFMDGIWLLLLILFKSR